MDLGHMTRNVVLQWCICMFVVDLGIVIIVIVIVMCFLILFLFFFFSFLFIVSFFPLFFFPFVCQFIKYVCGLRQTCCGGGVVCYVECTNVVKKW